MEVISVLVLISIFATIAVSRQPSTDVTLNAQASALKAHIRYAQMRAINTDTIWGIAVDPVGDSYALFKVENENDSKRILPGEDQTDVDLSGKGITITAESGSIRFNSWGRPMNNPASFIQLSKNGRTETITITPNTGFVP